MPQSWLQTPGSVPRGVCVGSTVWALVESPRMSGLGVSELLTLASRSLGSQLCPITHPVPQYHSAPAALCRAPVSIRFPLLPQALPCWAFLPLKPIPAFILTLADTCLSF